jgi:hypothetical protein
MPPADLRHRLRFRARLPPQPLAQPLLVRTRPAFSPLCASFGRRTAFLPPAVLIDLRSALLRSRVSMPVFPSDLGYIFQNRKISHAASGLTWTDGQAVAVRQERRPEGTLDRNSRA